jgi:protein-tyrosine phosphatase
MMSYVARAHRNPDFHVPSSRQTFAVLFVCTGNTCRSPMAEVVFNDVCATSRLADHSTLAEHLTVASAGTANWHVGSTMDVRARAALDRAGFAGAGTTAAHATATSLEAVDLAVAMDRGHLADLRHLAPSTRSSLLLAWGPRRGFMEVTDPFYGSEEDFIACLEVIAPACRALAADLASLVEARRLI